MKLTGVRRLIYPAVLLLLAFAIAGGSPGKALGQTPAAKYIGSDAYRSPTWFEADSPSSQHNYLGNLQSEKFFYADLPGNDAAKTANKVPGCGAKNAKGSYLYPATVLCIIVYNDIAESDLNLSEFLKSTTTDPHEIVLAFCNEPENGSHINGCMCATEEPCGTLPAFKSEFEAQSAAVTKFEAKVPHRNVWFAEDSWDGHYQKSADCSYILPASYVSYYLVDVYQGRNGNPTESPVPLSGDQAWNNWLTCTRSRGRPVGIAEFAINCGHEQNTRKHPYETAVYESFQADDQYFKGPFLKRGFPELEVWNLWDSGGCAINSRAEPGSVGTWRAIEAGA